METLVRFRKERTIKLVPLEHPLVVKRVICEFDCRCALPSYDSLHAIIRRPSVSCDAFAYGFDYVALLNLDSARENRKENWKPADPFVQRVDRDVFTRIKVKP